MFRWSITLIGMTALLGCIAAAQDSPSQLFSSDLVAWSRMQQPTSPEQQPQRQQPTPDPNPQSQPAPTPNAQTPAAPNSTETSTSPAQTFTGTISKEADSFTLKVSDTSSYKLDNQQQVQQYVGQRVRVTGTLDPASNLIHVERVEPMS
ncbi:MAG TPA: DUF5818 domain-containing protein [Terriglobales bacterium]|jgi:hypothetical protein|nr:DUF5818 domain-containing protein [Terriglobales bacterium]